MAHTYSITRTHTHTHSHTHPHTHTHIRTHTGKSTHKWIAYPQIPIYVHTFRRSVCIKELFRSPLLTTTSPTQLHNSWRWKTSALWYQHVFKCRHAHDSTHHPHTHQAACWPFSLNVCAVSGYVREWFIHTAENAYVPTHTGLTLKHIMLCHDCCCGTGQPVSFGASIWSTWLSFSLNRSPLD